MLKKIKKIFKKTSFPLFSLFFILVLPASTNYKLRDFGFGTGGIGNASSTDYKMDAITGEISGTKASSANYKIGSGLIFTNQANVPNAPTFDNPGNYYNRLRIILNPSDNPSDAKFAIAISDDNFVTTKYVQNDNTVGGTLGAEDYQTYASWGGVSGIFVIGLAPNTGYKVKVKATQGNFTETDYGPEAVAFTDNPTLTFDIDVSAIDIETDPPFYVNFGSLDANTVMDSPQKIWVDLATNGESGGKVYLIGQNSGLLSSTASYKIDSISGSLDIFSQGFGVQGSSATQASGGPFFVASLYDQIGNAVGITDQLAREIFSSSNPIIGGRGSFVLKVKSSVVTPSASDYSEKLTIIASGNF